MATPSPQTKITAVSKSPMNMGKVLTASTVTSNGGDSLKILGEIFKMMKIMDEDRKLNQEMVNSHLEEEEHKKEKRNQEIIKALTGRKKPKVKKPKVKKQEEPIKPSEKPPEGRPPKGKQPEAPRPETPKVEAPKPSPKPETPKAPEAPKTPPKAEAPTAPKPETPKPEILPQKPGIKPPPIATGSDSAIKEMIMQHEGKVKFPYKDSKGLWTIGVGHLIGDGKTLPAEYAAYKNNGGPFDKNNNTTPAMTDEQVAKLFEADYEKHKQIAMRTPGWNLANESGQAAMIDLSYNMGAWYNTDSWKNSNAVKSLKSGNFELAADHLKDSKWYGQVKDRGVKIVDMIRKGKKTDIQPMGVPPTSTNVDKASVENADMKKDLNAQSQALSSSTTFVNNTTQTTTNSDTPQVNDMSAAYNKSKETKK